MKHPIKINGHDLLIREYEGQRVVTFEDIDTVHERPAGTAKRNFNKNAKRFAEGKHFFRLIEEELKAIKQGTKNVLSDNSQMVIGGIGSRAKELILITEKGYLLLVKSLNDDLAWKVQEQLVDGYFRYKENLKKAQTAPEWQQARQVGKLNRLRETDELKLLVEYARQNGSRNADNYFVTYTKMVNAAVGIKSGQRDALEPLVLSALGLLENIVCTTIVQEIENGTEYHEIYNLCKARVSAVTSMITLPHHRLLLEKEKGGQDGFH